MDQSNLILGTYLFRFFPGAALPAAPDKPGNYTSNFGEVLNGALKFGGTVKEAWDSSSGVLGLLKVIKTKRDITLEGDLQKIDPTIVLPFLMGAASAAAPAAGKITDGFGFLAIQAEGEPIVPNPNTNEGAAIFRWHSFPCGLWVEGDLKANGEDYSTLKLNVRFYLARSAGTYTAAARPVTPVP